MTWLIRLAGAALLTCTFSTAGAQPLQYAIGRCFDQVNQVVFDVTPDFHIWNVNNPASNAQAMRDPAGMYFIRLPATQPWRQAFFISWDLKIVQLDVSLPGPMILGTCTFAAQAMPQQIQIPQFDMRLAKNQGVLGPNGQMLRTPRFLEINRSAISVPGIASPSSAQACLNATGPDRDQFAACMVPKMLTETQVRAYNCTQRNGGDKVLVSACLAKQIVGPNEARAIDQSTKCYKEHGKDYKKYPLCMAKWVFRSIVTSDSGLS